MRDRTPHSPRTPGRLWYLMGASGVGKDSILLGVHDRLADRPHIRFARRSITRTTDLGDEPYLSLSEEAFADRLRSGAFLLHWRSHGCAYGIGMEVLDWLRDGIDVCVNGSRTYLPTAQQRVPSLIPVLVYASPHRLLERLRRRGREAPADIESRMHRSQGLETPPDAILIDNDGALDDAIASLCRHILAALATRESASTEGTRCRDGAGD